MEDRAIRPIYGKTIDASIERTAPKISTALRLVLRFALLVLPVLALRVLFWPRPRGLAELSDHQLADIGLTRDDVKRPHERTSSAELEVHRLLQRRNGR